MALALALNRTLANPSLNMSLHSALEAVVFNGASVSGHHGGDNIMVCLFEILTLSIIYIGNSEI